MAQVWDSDLTDIYEAAVMLALANHADDEGRCYPSIARVAKLARCSVRKAQEVTKSLTKRGYLTIEQNTGPRGCNTYFLTLTPAQCAPPHDAHPRTPQQGPPHSTTSTPAQCAPEPSGNVRETSLPPTVPQGTNDKGSQPDPDQFEEFWERYPRKVAKKRARAAYVKALKSHDHDDIIFGLSQHLPSLEAKEPRFIPHAATWLNDERFADEPENPVSNQSASYGHGGRSDPHSQQMAGFAAIAVRGMTNA